MDIIFYQFNYTPILPVLQKILEKIIDQNLRAVVLCQSEHHMAEINNTLWTRPQMSFLPHGCRLDMNDWIQEQPIWITDFLENPNTASVLVNLSQKLISTPPHGIQKIIDFVESPPEYLEAGLGRFHAYTTQNFTPKWYVQTKENGWVYQNLK